MTPAEIDAVLNAERETLVDNWTKLIGRPPPERLSRSMMARILACELQWRACGRSRAQMLSKLDRAIAAAGSTKPKAAAGARLVREWNGRRHVVDVIEDGYLWRGERWRSLSAIAKEITGVKWSGPRFFGVGA